MAALVVGACDDGDGEAPLDAQSANRDAAAGLDGSSGGDESGDACGSDIEGGTSMRLPGTGVEYCVKADPSCLVATGSCPLYVMSNTGDTWFQRVDDPGEWGPFIIALSSGPRDGQGVKDWVAELPRVIAADYAGLDDQRIYMVGWSAGAGAVTRGHCQSSKGYDESSYGTTSDVYAAITVLGGCPGCSTNFAPLAGNFHVFATNGREDQFGGDGCEEKLRNLALTNGCSDPNAGWRPVVATDPYVDGADGSVNAEKLSFGTCEAGDVLSYRFADEGHVVSYDAHWDPKIRSYDLVWRFLQGRTKGDDSVRGIGE